MLDVVPALLVTAALTGALWLLQHRLFGAAGSRSRDVQLLGDFVNHVETSEKVVALTFDDGPEATYTQSVIGAACDASPQSLEALVQARHEIGKHLIAAPYYLWRHGRTTVMWDVEPDSIGDIAGDPDAMTAYVMDTVRPGSIILIHVMYGGREASRAALPRIIETLTAAGYRFVTVSDLLTRRDD